MCFRLPHISFTPVERILAQMMFLAGALSLLYGIAPRSRWDFYLMQTLGAADNYVIGLAVVGSWILGRALLRGAKSLNLRERGAQGIAEFGQQYLTPRELVRDARMLGAALVLLAVFGQLKHLIPWVNRALYDGILVASERAVFGGRLAGEWLHVTLGSAWAPIMSASYTAYYYYLTTIVLVFVLQRNRRLASEFLTAFSLIWLIGVVIAYAIPTLGPCYAVAEIYKHLPETSVSVLQQHLWFQKLVLERNPGDSQAVYLIAALPSLHVGVLLLGTYYLRRVSPLLMGFSALQLVMTGLATIYFGWHYVVDLLAAAVLVSGAVLMSRSIHGAKEVRQ